MTEEEIIKLWTAGWSITEIAHNFKEVLSGYEKEPTFQIYNKIIQAIKKTRD